MARYLMTHSLLSSWLYAMKENPYEDASTERDPYREFGLPMRFLDKPTHIARPMIVSEVKEAIEKFEPRATFVRVLFDEDASIPGRVIPTVEVEINE